MELKAFGVDIWSLVLSLCIITAVALAGGVACLVLFALCSKLVDWVRLFIWGTEEQQKNLAIRDTVDRQRRDWQQEKRHNPDAKCWMSYNYLCGMDMTKPCFVCDQPKNTHAAWITPDPEKFAAEETFGEYIDLLRKHRFETEEAERFLEGNDLNVEKVLDDVEARIGAMMEENDAIKRADVEQEFLEGINQEFGTNIPRP